MWDSNKIYLCLVQNGSINYNYVSSANKSGLEERIHVRLQNLVLLNYDLMHTYDNSLPKY